MGIFDAIQAGDLAAVQREVDADGSAAAARNAAGVSALMWALYNHKSEIAAYLLGMNTELDVFEAAAAGVPARLRELLAADTSRAGAYSSDGFTPLHFAGFFDQEGCADVLLEHGAPVDAVTRNDMANQPLHAAAAGGNIHIIGKLIAAGADVNARQHGGYTALHEAAMKGDDALVDLLLKSGADTSLLADEGKTALDIAREHGHARIIELLEGMEEPR